MIAKRFVVSVSQSGHFAISYVRISEHKSWRVRARPGQRRWVPSPATWFDEDGETPVAEPNSDPSGDAGVLVGGGIEVVLAPLGHRVDHAFEILPALREIVLDAERLVAHHLPGDQLLLLKVF